MTLSDLLSSKDTTEPLSVEPNTPISETPHSSLQSPPSSPVYPRHSSFYYDYRTFLVEGILFRFPINLLAKESQIFRDMMEVPSPSQTEGLTDQNPIRLDGVLNDDFVHLLTVLAPPQRFKEPVPALSFPEWTSVLKLADMWCMDVVKEHAISTMVRLPGVDPVDKVVVARRYGIKSWLTPSFNAILQRSQPWNEHDVERLGLSTVLKLVEFRDRLRPVDIRYGNEVTWQLATARVGTSTDFSGVIKELPDFEAETVECYVVEAVLDPEITIPSDNAHTGNARKSKKLKRR